MFANFILNRLWIANSLLPGCLSWTPSAAARAYVTQFAVRRYAKARVVLHKKQFRTGVL